MSARHFALFETAIGHCGVVWSERGIAAVQLPEASAEKTRARLMRRFPDAQEAKPSGDAQRAIEGMVALLSGERRDLRDIPLDIHVPDFNRRVLDVARSIPAGSTLSYGEISVRLGDPSLAREVGQALGQNPCPLIVPCHRVLAAGGKTGGFSANGGVTTKLKLLTIEGAQPGGPTLFEELPLIARQKPNLPEPAGAKRPRSAAFKSR